MGLLYHSEKAKNTSSNKEISRHLRTIGKPTFTRDVTTGRVQRHKKPIHVLISCYFLQVFRLTLPFYLRLDH